MDNSVSNGKINRTAPDVFPFTIYCPGLSAANWRLEASVALYSAVALLTSLSQCYPRMKKPLNPFIDVAECDLFW